MNIVQSTREKPETIPNKRVKPTEIPIPAPIITPQPQPQPPHEIALQTPIPESESDSEIQVGRVIRTKTLTRVFHNHSKYDKLDEDSATEELHEVELKRNHSDSDSDDYDNVSKSHNKTKKKKKKIKDDDDDGNIDITDTINDVATTVNETVKVIGKNVAMQLLTQIVKSKQFMIILVLITIFGGCGWLLKIIVH